MIPYGVAPLKAGYFYGGVWIHTQIEVGERLVKPGEATGHSIALPDLRELEKNPSCCNITLTETYCTT